MKKGIAFLLALAMSVPLIGCSSDGGTSSGSGEGNSQAASQTGDESSASGDKIVLDVVTMTGYGNGLEANKEFMKKYTEEVNPNVEINLEELSIDGSEWNVYVSKLATMAASGTLPDVFDMATEGIQMVYKNNLAQPLNTYFDSHEGIYESVLEDTYDPKLIEPFINGEDVYGLVTMWNPCITHLNTDYLEEAGLSLPSADWDTDEFLRYCEALTKTNEDGSKRYALLVPDYYFAVSAWLFSWDASFLNEDWTEAACDSENAIECFQFIHDLIYKYQYAPVPQPNDNYQQMFVDGQIAMITARRWPLATYEANGFRTVGVQYNPSFKTQANVYGTQGFMISSTTDHYDEACEFLVWTASEDFIKEYVKFGSTPSRLECGEEIIESAGYPENREVFFETLTKGMKSVEAPTSYADLGTIFDTYFSMMMTDENADIASICQQMADEMDVALQK